MRLHDGKAPRCFELHLAVRYRTSRDTSWRTGVSRSVSIHSAVIHADDPPSVFDAVEVVIALSDAGCLVGRGRVIRTQPSSAGSSADFSITVNRYTICRRDSALSLYTPVLHGC